jgi:hypothetical protein
MPKKDPFAAASLKNRAQAHILRRDTNSDFKVTQSGIDAIMANLQTTQTGLGRKLARTNARGLEAMGRISDRSNARMDNILARGKSQVNNRYGDIIAADPNLFAGVARVGRSQAKVNKGQLKAGELQSRAGNEAQDILQTAATSAAASGQYELAQALRERSSADSETIAASRLALAQQRADAAANERYLRLQTRLANGGAGGEGFSQAAEQLQGLQQGGATQAEAENSVNAMAIQYNLGPAAKAKLTQMVDALYGGSGGSATEDNSTPYGTAYRKETGLSPSAALPDDQESALNAAVVGAFKPGQPVPTTAQVMSLMGVHLDEAGKYVNGEGTELSADYVAAAIAYAQSTWYRQQQAYDANQSGTSTTPTGPTAGPTYSTSTTAGGAARRK